VRRDESGPSACRATGPLSRERNPRVGRPKRVTGGSRPARSGARRRGCPPCAKCVSEDRWCPYVHRRASVISCISREDSRTRGGGTDAAWSKPRCAMSRHALAAVRLQPSLEAHEPRPPPCKHSSTERCANSGNLDFYNTSARAKPRELSGLAVDRTAPSSRLRERTRRVKTDLPIRAPPPGRSRACTTGVLACP
jgi:hypothetical protein